MSHIVYYSSQVGRGTGKKVDTSHRRGTRLGALADMFERLCQTREGSAAARQDPGVQDYIDSPLLSSGDATRLLGGQISMNCNTALACHVLLSP